MKAIKIVEKCLILSLFVFFNIIPSMAQSYSNESEVRATLEDGWTVVYGMKFDEVDYIEFTSAVALSIDCVCFEPVSAYLTTVIDDNWNVVKDIGLGLSKELLTDIVYKAIIGEPSAALINNIQVDAGLATYNRWDKWIANGIEFHECTWRIDRIVTTGICSGETTWWTEIPYPNHHQLYFRYRYMSNELSQTCTDQLADAPTRFRAVANYAVRNGYAAGYPNFHQATYDGIGVIGAILFHPDAAYKIDVRAVDLGLDENGTSDFQTRMRAVYDYGVRNGYGLAYPDFHQALDHEERLVYGVIVIPQAEWQDVASVNLALGDVVNNDIGMRFRALNDYAVQHGYIGGIPNFHVAGTDNGVVYGSILIPNELANWADITSCEIAM